MDEIEKIAEELNEIKNARAKLAKEFCEIDLKRAVSENPLDRIKICGVDGGLLRKEYAGAGLILARAVGACFAYENGKLVSADYFPARNPRPEPILAGAEYSANEFNLLASLKREEIELKTAIACVEKFLPDILLRDGSVVLYPSNVPEKGSLVYSVFENVINLFKELYSACKRNNCLLAGAVEDSRGKRYCRYLSGLNLFDCKILERCSDILFLQDFLRTKERTNAVSYSEEELPSLAGLEDWKKRILCFYLKAVEFDRPLRIDFVCDGDAETTADKIASIIYAISKQNRLYSFPSVLIEADGRAKLSELELASHVKQLRNKLGLHNLMLNELRREGRPF